MNKPIGTVRSCRVASAQQWRQMVAERVARWIISCEDAGLSHWDIATRVGCHRTQISLWKHGKADLYAGSYVALEQLAAECAGRKAV